MYDPCKKSEVAQCSDDNHHADKEQDHFQRRRLHESRNVQRVGADQDGKSEKRDRQTDVPEKQRAEDDCQKNRHRRRLVNLEYRFCAEYSGSRADGNQDADPFYHIFDAQL